MITLIDNTNAPKTDFIKNAIISKNKEITAALPTYKSFVQYKAPQQL